MIGEGLDGLRIGVFFVERFKVAIEVAGPRGGANDAASNVEGGIRGVGRRKTEAGACGWGKDKKKILLSDQLVCGGVLRGKRRDAVQNEAISRSWILLLTEPVGVAAQCVRG